MSASSYQIHANVYVCTLFETTNSSELAHSDFSSFFDFSRSLSSWFNTNEIILTAKNTTRTYHAFETSLSTFHFLIRYSFLRSVSLSFGKTANNSYVTIPKFKVWSSTNPEWIDKKNLQPRQRFTSTPKK